MESLAAPITSPLSALKAVADPCRLRLLRLLDLEELSVGELVRCTQLTQSSVSRHLAVLKRAGLLEDRSEGVRHYLRLAEVPPEDVRPLLDAVMQLVRAADLEEPEDLARLERVRLERTADREAIFDLLADDWDALRAQLLGGALGPLEVAALLLPAGMRIVDAGTGTGVLLPWLSAVAGPSGAVVAVERSEAMARRAIERAETLPNVEIRRGSIEELPVPDGWADVVLLCLSLGHTTDADDAIARCSNALRPGGRLVICDVAAHDDDAVVRRLGRGFAGFDPERLEQSLRAAGLEGVRQVDLPAAPLGNELNTNHAGRPSRTSAVKPLCPLYVVGTKPTA